MAGEINIFRQKLLKNFKKKNGSCVFWAPEYFLSLLAGKLNPVKPMLTRNQLLQKNNRLHLMNFYKKCLAKFCFPKILHCTYISDLKIDLWKIWNSGRKFKMAPSLYDKNYPYGSKETKTTKARNWTGKK